MFSTAAAGQTFEAGLTPVKGFYADLDAALTREAKLRTTDLDGTAFPGGRVGTIHTDGTIRLGGGAAIAPPLFLFNGNADPGVRNTGVSPTSGRTYWKSVMPSGAIMALVGLGAYELQTTEFDQAQTYVPNTALTANVTTGVVTNQGAVKYTNWICGIASWAMRSRTIDAAPTGPEGVNAYQIPVLQFYTYFLPAA